MEDKDRKDSLEQEEKNKAVQEVQSDTDTDTDNEEKQDKADNDELKSEDEQFDESDESDEEDEYEELVEELENTAKIAKDAVKLVKDINSKQLRIDKLVCVALAALCIGGIVKSYTINELQTTIQHQQEQITELAEFSNYDLEEHKAIKTLSQVNNDAKKFRESDYFANHKLDAGMNRDLAFNVQGDTYYVLFYMEDCSHCNALESDMFDNISKIMKKDIFYYDAETFTDDSEFEWANTNPGDKYTSTKREFKVYGTPTLVKVSPGTEKIKVFMGNEAIEEELGLS